MSSRRKCRLDIKNADEQTLKQAVQLLAKEIGAEVTTNIGIFGGNTVIAPCGIKMAGLEKGIGFRIEDGTVVSDGDSWRQEREYARVETLLKQTYGYVDSINKMSKQGFSVVSTLKVYGNKIEANVTGMKMTNA